MEMQQRSQNRRRKLVVNKPMQGRMMLSMALIPGAALIGVAILTAIYASRITREALATDSDLPDVMPLFYLVIAFEVVAGFIMVINSLRVSHTVAGPAYRICKSIERIRGGDLAFKVTLRKGDHLTEVRDEMNKLLDWLNENPPAGCTTRAMAAAQEAAQEPASTGEGAAPSTETAAAAAGTGQRS